MTIGTGLSFGADKITFAGPVGSNFRTTVAASERTAIAIAKFARRAACRATVCSASCMSSSAAALFATGIPGVSADDAQTTIREARI